MRSLRRLLIRYKHSPRKKKHILAGSITVIIALFVISLLGYQSITGMYALQQLDTAQLEDELYNEINELRKANRIENLNESLKLEQIARRHSRNMAIKKKLESRNYLTIFEQEYLDCRYHAENILKTKNPNILEELNETHMNTILNPNLEKIGIGIVFNKSFYVTQDFCG